MDERFIIHRLRATRLAAIIGIILMGISIIYYFFADHIYRVDLIVIMVIMAITKWITMIYYKKTN